MRTVFTIVLLLVVSGLVYTTHAAGAPVPGIDYEIEQADDLACRSGEIPGDGLVSRFTAFSRQTADVPDEDAGTILYRLSCMFKGH
jgi:hypothetical protein